MMFLILEFVGGVVDIPPNFSGLRSLVSLLDLTSSLSPSLGRRFLRDLVRPEKCTNTSVPVR
ncbi:hypothetical protein E2C01_046610 [Portunus trituberculatus]|uniref:Uncharacterized protein n=1 Tax=Portunus trituberculatus TaxID=210409 RepID=A0A5B7G880_PORTR|nr:hypothetical protein [Portunus trituberculatus]